MRILIVTDQFPPVTFGGMAQHAWHIAHILSERHTVCVLVARSQKEDWRQLPFDISPNLSIRFPALDVISILWTALKFKPDVIHVCNAALSYQLVSKYYPIVTRVVGNDFLRPWCGYGLPLRSLLYRLPSDSLKVRLKELEIKIRKSKAISRLQRVDSIVVNSEWTRNQLSLEGISEECIHIVAGGVDTTIFQPAIERSKVRAKIGISDDSLIILTASHLYLNKGIDTILRAFVKLSQKWSLLHYVIVGDGVDETILCQLASTLGINHKVIFVGRKTQKELRQYYQSSDIYIQVSMETMGRTYMEAGACGLPVVAANVGGVPSVVTDNINGILVNNLHDIEGIILAVERLLVDENLRKRMGNAGFDMVRKKFSWEQVAAQFEDVMLASVNKSEHLSS